MGSGYAPGGCGYWVLTLPNTARPRESLGLGFPTLEGQLLAPSADGYPTSHL